MKTLDLNGRWEFKACSDVFIPRELKDELKNWHPAFVPGTVHLDLLSAGLIPDPFFEINESIVQWIDKTDWTYRKRFEVDFNFQEFDSIRLVFEGLDTVGSVKLNDQVLGEFNNMFIPHTFEVKNFLRRGENQVEVIFKSPTLVAKELESKYGKLPVELASHRVYLRKAQYSFGWDWGPVLTTSGIWRPVRLEFLKFAKIKNFWFKTLSLNKTKAEIQFEVELEKFTADDVELKLTILFDGEVVYEREFVQKGGDRVRRHKFELREPKLWFPNGYGSSNLYTGVVEIYHSGELLHRVEKKFGVRSLRLIQEDDGEGESFIFEINGEKIFCKGANWIPVDSFLPRARKEDYNRLLEMAVSANLNMLRVWGGGIYENEYFYQRCDELGIMVWQDFMFACAGYPENEKFIRNVKNEAIHVVKSLRNHPSLVIWCGNNESEWIWVDKTGKDPDEMPGAKIFRDILKEIVEVYDGTRPYLRSSPWGKLYPNSETDGNHHQWRIWSGWADYREYENINAKFITEFGFQAPPHPKTLYEVIEPENRNFNSPSIEHRNKQVEGIPRLFRFLLKHHKLTSDFEDLIYRMQVNQAEAIKFAVENWRLRKFKTAGTIFWQWNDCWHVISWSAIDYRKRPKALYYFARNFFNPVLIALKKVGEKVQIWLVNDLLTPVNGVVQIKTMSVNGDILFEESFEITVSGNSSALVFEQDESYFCLKDFEKNYIYAKFVSEGKTLSENSLFFVEPKFLKLPSRALKCKLSKISDGEYTLTISSTGLLKSVFIDFEDIDAELSDNFFDVQPNSVVEVRIKANAEIKSLLKSLKIKTLAD